MIKTYFSLWTLLEKIDTFQFFPEDIFYCAEDSSLIYLLHIIWFLYFYNIYEQDYDNVCSMLETITHHVVTLKAVRLGDVARYVRL